MILRAAHDFVSFAACVRRTAPKMRLAHFVTVAAALLLISYTTGTFLPILL